MDHFGEGFELGARGQLQAVAGAIHGLDEAGFARIRFELGAQVANVDADRFDVVIGLVAPNLLEDEGRGHCLAMALQQAVQQFKFQVGEPHRLLEPDRLKAFGHQGEAAVVEDFVVLAGNGGPHAAAQQGLHPHQQLLEVKGLGEVVIGAGIEAAHLVLDASQGCEHQDRDLGGALIPAQPLAEGEAIDVGQHQIQQDQVRAVLQGQGLALDAVGGALDLKTAVLQVAGHQVQHVAVVFDQQDAGLHGVKGGLRRSDKRFRNE